MAFKMKYTITPMYIPVNTKRRSGIKINKVGFIVAHDTGNPNSTARQNVKYFINSANEMSASAHVFIDDKEIIECIPALLAEPEKAWHVLYEKTKDNELYGDDANDIALGFEYCYGTNINADEAYKRYIWSIAYAIYKYNLKPTKDVIGHFILDPQRKTDPQSGLKASGRNYEQLLKDIAAEYDDCTKSDKPKTEFDIALDKLVKKGIISSPDYWESHAQPDAICLGEYVQKLILNMAKEVK